jgi:hypothetical protein
MKYVISIVIACLAIGTVISGYFILSKNTGTGAQTSVQPTAEGTRITKMQGELVELKETLDRQSVSLQKLTEDNAANRAKITGLEQQLRNATAIIQALLLEKKGGEETAGSSESGPQSSNKTTALSATLLNQIASGEVFKDPQVAKAFQERVAEALKNIQQEEREAQRERFTQQMQQRLNRRIEDFATKQNLNDYQKQELVKALAEGNKQTMDLFTQVRDQKITLEQFTTQQDTIRKGVNASVQQVLSPQQYEEYKKVEPSILRGPMFGRGNRNQPPPPPTNPPAQNK